MYALNLSNSGRILSATFAQYAPDTFPRVDELPDGDITNYLYVDSEFVYDPNHPEPVIEASLDDYKEQMARLGVKEDE